MPSKEELEKLNVAQLREKLKSRKLTTSGNKPDLVQRLYDDMLAEDSLLGVSAPGASGPSDIDLSGLDVDEVLGLGSGTGTGALLSPPPPQQKVPAEPTPPSIKVAKVPIQAPAQTQPKGITTTPATAAPAPTEPNNNESGAVKPTVPVTDLDKKVQLKAAARMGLPVADSIKETVTSPAPAPVAADDAKAKRAARFGLVSNTPISNDAQSKRAARFGIAAANGSSNQSAVSDEMEKKRLERAKRFGLPLQETSATADGTPAQKGKKRSGPSDEVLQARAKRFGGPVASEEEEEKKKARLARFGAAASS